jgi:hypothetical protein
LQKQKNNIIMKNAEQIATELSQILSSTDPRNFTEYKGDDKNWTIYRSLSGWSEGKYFNIVIKQAKDRDLEIDIAHNTENIPFFIEIISSVQEGITVYYYQIEYKYTTTRS